MLKFNVRNQTINRIDNFSATSGSVNYLIAEFNFKTDNWRDVVKTAIFKNPATKKEYDQILDDDHCVVPWEAISDDGKSEVSIYGLTSEYKITTGIETFKINPTLSGGSATQEPTPTVYEQLLEKMGNVDGGTFADWSE